MKGQKVALKGPAQKLCFCLCLFLLLPLLASPSHAEERIKLKVFSLPDPRDSSAFNQAEIKVIDAFRKRYPHIELIPFSGIQIAGMAMDSKPLLAIAGGVAPDVLYVNFRQSDTYVSRGFLYPLDEFVNEMSPEELKLRVPKAAWPVMKRPESKGAKPHVWMMPFATYIRVLVYRKDLFERKGLDPEKPPQNWDELWRYAKQLTDPLEGTYGMELASGPQAAWDWITYLWSAGGDAVRLNTDGDWEACFNGPAGVKAMQFYLSLITPKWRDARGREHEGFVIREGNLSNLWSQGKIGMRMTYLNEQNLGKGLDPNLYGIAPVPVGPTGIRGAELNCAMMGIFAEAGISNNARMGPRDPVAVRRAAWNYIRFMDSEEARKIRISVMVESGYGKTQNPLFLRRYGYEQYLKFVPPGLEEVFQQAMAGGKPEPYGRNCQMVYRFMTQPLEQCISKMQDGGLGATEVEQEENIAIILDKAVTRTNEEMIGNLPEAERKRRNNMAFVVAILIMSGFCYVLYRVWKMFTPPASARAKGWMLSKYTGAYILILPGLLSIILWKYVPMFMGSVMAFQDYGIVGDSEWVGMANFADVLWDGTWWASVGRTLLYMVLFLSLAFWPPIVLAILLQEVSHGKILYRTIYYLPSVITGVIVIYLWKLMYDPSDAGGLNQILLFLGFEKLSWLRDESLAMICCIIPTIWAGTGPGCLIYLAALKGIPDDSYEAADIDGATFCQKVRHIVFPSIKSLIIIQFIASFIAASQQTGFILIMTFGGPNDATKVAGLHIFEKAYLYLKFGTATTMAWLLGMMLMGFTVFQLKRLSKMEFKAQGNK